MPLVDLAALARAAYEPSVQPGAKRVGIEIEGHALPTCTCVEEVNREHFRALVLTLGGDGATAVAPKASAADGEWTVRPGQTVVISFRGSVSLENWAFNILHIGHRLFRVMVQFAMGVDKSVAEELTQSAMGKTFLRVFEMLHDLIPKVIQRAAAVPNTRVILVGHSMGGFLAQLNCASYGLHGVTFNAPPLGSYEPKGRYEMKDFAERLIANASMVENHRMRWDVASNSASSGMAGLGHHHGRLTTHQHALSPTKSLDIHSLPFMIQHFQRNPACPERTESSGDDGRGMSCGCVVADPVLGGSSGQRNGQRSGRRSGRGSSSRA